METDLEKLNPTPATVDSLIQEIETLKQQNLEVSKAGFDLISAQAKLQSLLHNASDGIITFDADGTVQSFNIAAQKIFGYTEGEIISRKISHLIPCPDWVEENVCEYIRYFISSRPSENIPLLGKHKLGFDILLHVTTGQASNQEIELFSEDDDIELFDNAETGNDAESNSEELLVCFIRDITLHKQAERELAQHKLALDQAASVIIYNKDFRITHVNSKFCQTLGRPREEFIGEKNIIETAFSKKKQQELNHKRQFLTDGNCWSGEVFYLSCENKTIWFTENTTPFFDEHDQPSQYLSILNDITATKESEAELKKHRDNLQELVNEQVESLIQAKDKAEIANQAKSEFLANMSHELRTPLHAILSFSTLGLKQFNQLPFTAENQSKIFKFLENINSSGKRLLVLLNDLLDLAKYESRTMEYVFEQHDLFTLSQQIVEEHSGQLNSANIQLNLKVSEAQNIAEFDKNRIAQVISNLISNSIKFTPPEKSIYIFIEYKDITTGRRITDKEIRPGIIFNISDQGIGIPKAELETVFDKFIQSSKTKSGAGGTGLGLSICKEIILGHHGNIWAESKPNAEAGAIFRFEIPLKQTAIK